MIVNIRPRISNQINVNANDNLEHAKKPIPLIAIETATQSTPIGAVVMGAAIGPLGGIKDALDHMNTTLDNIGAFFSAVGYWINPVNLWHELGFIFSSGSLDTPLIVGTILGGILMMGGATWPKKWIFWGWVLFWILRVVFA